MLTIALAAVVALMSVATSQDLPVCMPNDRTMEALVVGVRAGIGGSKIGSWHGIPMARRDTELVKPVQDDSLCRLALKTLNAYLENPLPKGDRIRLLYMRNSFFAEHVPNPGQIGEFSPQYIFDSTLTKVLFPCRNGQAKC